MHYRRWVLSAAISQYPSAILSCSFQKTFKTSDSLHHMLSFVWVQQKNATDIKTGDFSHSASNRISLQKTGISFHLYHRALWKFHQWRVKWGVLLHWVLLHTLPQRKACAGGAATSARYPQVQMLSGQGELSLRDLCPQEFALIHINVFCRNWTCQAEEGR